MEEHALRALGMLENRMDGGDRAAQILEIQSDRYMDQRRIADAGFLESRRAAFVGIAENRRPAEGEFVGGCRQLEVGVAVRRPNRLRRVEGLERRGEHNHHHRGGDEPREPHYPQHFLRSSVGESLLLPPRFEIETIGDNRRDEER